MAQSIEELAEAALLEMDEATRQWAGEIADLLATVAGSAGAAVPGVRGEPTGQVLVPRDLVNRLLAQHGCAMVGLQVASLRPAATEDRPACMWCELAVLVREQCP